MNKTDKLRYNGNDLRQVNFLARREELKLTMQQVADVDLPMELDLEIKRKIENCGSLEELRELYKKYASEVGAKDVLTKRAEELKAEAKDNADT
jgi:hypothetical protein